MFGRLFKRNPHTHKRAQALIVYFLKKHRERVSGMAFARHLLANVKKGGADGALDGFGPHAQAQLGYYPEYAVHLARYALVYCWGLVEEPPDPEWRIVQVAAAIWQGLGVDLETAGELAVQTLENSPRNDEGYRFSDDEFDALSEKERRLVLIEDIARDDAQIVLEAFGNGDRTIDLSDHDVDPLADLLEICIIPDPDHERLAAKIKRNQS